MFEIITTKRREELELKISLLDNRVRNLTADREDDRKRLAKLLADRTENGKLATKWHHQYSVSQQETERARNEIAKTARVLESLYARRMLAGIGVATVVSFFVGVATVILSAKWEWLRL